VTAWTAPWLPSGKPGPVDGVRPEAGSVAGEFLGGCGTHLAPAPSHFLPGVVADPAGRRTRVRSGRPRLLHWSARSNDQDTALVPPCQRDAGQRGEHDPAGERRDLPPGQSEQDADHVRTAFLPCPAVRGRPSGHATLEPEVGLGQHHLGQPLPSAWHSGEEPLWPLTCTARDTRRSSPCRCSRSRSA